MGLQFLCKTHTHLTIDIRLSVMIRTYRDDPPFFAHTTQLVVASHPAVMILFSLIIFCGGYGSYLPWLNIAPPEIN